MYDLNPEHMAFLQVPDASEFDSAVPLRVRVERNSSLNNRFKPDPL